MPIPAVDPAPRLEVEDTVVRLFVAADERDWPTVEASFTDPFRLDMTSLGGGEPAMVSPQELAKAWAELFRGFDHVHHQVGNWRTQVAGSSATVRCHGLTFHHRAGVVSGGRTRTFVGTYEFDLQQSAARWRISRMQYRLKFIDGNVGLEKAV